MRFYLYWTFIATALILILRGPFWGVVIYSCMNIIRPELLFWGGKYSSLHSMEIIFITIPIGILFNLKQVVWDHVKQRELILLFLLYAGVIASNVLSEYDLYRQYYYANELLIVAVFCAFLCLLISSKEKAATYQNYLLFFMVLLALWGVDQHFRGNERLEKLGGYDSNGVASFFVLFAPLAFHKIVTSATWRGKGASFFALIAIVLAIIFSQSRGGLLGLIAAFLAYIALSKKRGQILIALCLLGMTTIPFISNQYTGRMSTMTSKEKLDGSAESRLYLWQAGLMIFMDNPLFGTGLLSYPIEKFKYENRFQHLEPEYRVWLFREQDPKVTHNTYIKFLSDCGLAAGLPYFFLISGTFLANRKVRQRMAAGGLRDSKTVNLLSAIECGLWGNCLSNFFIDANFLIFPYIQMICCAIIRKLLNHRTSGQTIINAAS